MPYRPSSPAATRITVVAGPPCSGKTTYVEQHRAPDDLVVDWDTLATALGSPVSHGHSQHVAMYVTEARNAVLTRLGRLKRLPFPAKVWVIAGAPTLIDRNSLRLNLSAEVVVLEVDAVVCKQRAAAAGRPARWPALIDEWWSRYQPDARDLRPLGAKARP